MSYSRTPRMREIAKRKTREAMREMRENRKLIKKYIGVNMSRREIATALGIPEDSPLFEQP